MTVAPVVELKFVAGDQLYELAPPAVIVTDAPEQIAPELTVTVGTELTVTVEVALDVQEFASVPVTV